jgi:hypothetical protein
MVGRVIGKTACFADRRNDYLLRGPAQMVNAGQRPARRNQA